MKYPLHTQSKPVSGLAAKKLLEAIAAQKNQSNSDRYATANSVNFRVSGS